MIVPQYGTVKQHVRDIENDRYTPTLDGSEDVTVVSTDQWKELIAEAAGWRILSPQTHELLRTVLTEEYDMRQGDAYTVEYRLGFLRGRLQFVLLELEHLMQQVDEADLPRIGRSTGRPDQAHGNREAIDPRV